jgi:hypothetical protein
MKGKLTIETIIKDQPRSRLGKSVTSSIRACSLGEIGRQGPTSDGEKDLELAVLLLEEEQLFDAAIYVVSGFIPGITRIVFVDIREWISQKPVAMISRAVTEKVCFDEYSHFSRIGSDIGEGVENMSQFVRGKVESMVVALIDCLVDCQLGPVGFVRKTREILTQLTKYAIDL